MHLCSDWEVGVVLTDGGCLKVVHVHLGTDVPLTHDTILALGLAVCGDSVSVRAAGGARHLKRPKVCGPRPCAVEW